MIYEAWHTARVIDKNCQMAKNRAGIMLHCMAWGTGKKFTQGGEPEGERLLAANHGVVKHDKGKRYIIHPDNVVIRRNATRPHHSLFCVAPLLIGRSTFPRFSHSQSLSILPSPFSCTSEERFYDDYILLQFLDPFPTPLGRLSLCAPWSLALHYLAPILNVTALLNVFPMWPPPYGWPPLH